MEGNLINLIECNYFTSKQDSEIINIINKKCSKDLSRTLEALLNEIDNAFVCDYMKKLEIHFDKTEHDSYKTVDEINKAVSVLENIQNNSDVIFNKSELLIETIRAKFDEISELERKYQLIEQQQRQMEIISAIQSSFIIEDIELACNNLVQLINTIRVSNEPQTQAEKLILIKLNSYHQKISAELKKTFEECLKEINWPFISNSLQRTTNELGIEKIQSASTKFSSIFLQLYLIELPESLQYVANDKPDLINTKFMANLPLARISIPVQLLLSPLVKYFKFFFCTESKVNRLAKPEWYMTQVIQWIVVHFSILGELFTETVMEIVDGRLEFIRGLVVMVMGKIQNDFDAISMKNDDLFFHLIEESLTMTIDLRKSFDYPRSYPDPVDVICNKEETFDHWMKLEQRFASQQLDEVFRSAGSWQILSRNCKRVECLNSFIGLINAIKERIQCLFDVSKQARFCEVMLEVLDDFRRRLLQISKDYNANSQRWYDIMNIIYNVRILLRNWRLEQIFIGIHSHLEVDQNKASIMVESMDNSENGSSDHFIPKQSKHLSFTTSSLYSSRTRTIENMKLSSDSVFSNVLSLYQHVLDEMEEKCINSAFEDVSERADSYTKKSWLEIGPNISSRLMSLSPSASGMLLVLRDRLYGLESALEQELFEHVWQGLAMKFNKMLFDSVIRAHRFNDFGACQLDFDIRKNLLPLFHPYTKSPERFFIKCLEACILLNLKRGTAMLIKQILAETLHTQKTGQIFSRSRPECPIRTLTEIGVLTLLPEDAEYVLNLRTDSDNL